MTFDTLRWLVFPAPHRIQRLQSLLSSLLHRGWATARELVSLLGQMESFAPLVPLGRLHKRKFQHLFRDRWCQACHPWYLHIPLGEWFQQSTSQWGKIEWLSQGVPIMLPGTPVHRHLSGGVGGTCGPPHSLWPPAGAHDVLSHQHSGTGGCCPGTQTVFPLSGRQESLPPHAQHDGGMLHQQAGGEPILGRSRREWRNFFCDAKSVHPVVIPVCSGQVEHSGWPPAVGMDTLVHAVLKPIWSAWFTPHIDRFATRFSHRLPVCVSPVPDPVAWAVDALSIPWSNLLSHTFPQIPIKRKVLRKARDERATLILVVPHWPAQAWFPELLHLCHVPPIRFPLGPWSLLQPRSGVRHGNPGVLHLHAWRLCGGLAVFTRCFLLCAPLGGACSLSRHSGHVLHALGRLGQMVWGSFGPAS